MYSTRVSFVTVVFNGAPYLDKYFDSLLNQTLKEIEIICVNNVSTDNSLKILQKYAASDIRITVINNKENNIGGAVNLGIKRATSKYICPVDQDDWVDVNMFKTLIDHSENETADMVCSDYYEYHNENDIRKIINIPSAINNTVEAIKKNVLLNGGRLYTNIIKKTLFIDNNLFYPENLFYPDNAIGAALYCIAKKIIHVNKHFYYYRVSNESLTRSKDNYRFFDRLATSNMLLDNMKRCGLYEKYKEETDYSYYKLFYKNSITGCFSRFSVFPSKYINQIKIEFNQQGIDIKNNIYYKSRNRTYEDFILGCIEINTNFGKVLFRLYKLLIPFKKFIYK
jgi:glycosyltransferase involved in cell wall biosynthesis